MGIEASNNIEKQKKTDIDLKSVFLKEFNSYMLKTKDKNSFIDTVMNNDSFTGTSLEKDIEKFIANNDKFKGFKISEVNIFDLKRYIAKEYLSLDNTRKAYISNIKGNYKITDEQFKKIETEIKKLSIEDLNDLINSDLHNTKFLKKIFGKNLIKQNSYDAISLLNSENIRSRLLTLPEEEQIEINKILYKFNKTGKLGDVDLKILFETGIFSVAQKKEFINRFIPFVSLKKAKDIGLIKESQLEKLKEDILYPVLNKQKLSDREIRDIISNTNPDDILISTNDFTSNLKYIDILAQQVGFRKFEEDIDEINDEIKKDLENKGPQTLDDLKVAIESKDDKNRFSGISKMGEGSVLKFIEKTNDGKETVSYVKIVKVDNESKSFSYRVIGNNDKIVQNSKNELNTKTYVDFLDTLEKTSYNLEVYTDEEIEEKIKKGEIGRVADSYSSLDEATLLEDIDKLNNDLKEKRKELEKRNKTDEVIKIKESLEDEIKSLKKALKKEKDLVEQTSIKEKISKKETELEKYIDIEKDQEYVQILDNIFEKQNQLSNLSELNFNKLIDDLNSIDSEGSKLESSDGRKGLYKGMVIETKDGAYEIKGIDKDNAVIELFSNGVKGGIEQLSFHDFFDAFKAKEAKRKDKINNFEELINELSKDNDSWKNHEFKDNKFIAKNVQDGAKESDMEIEYFISDKEDEIIKIKSIKADKIIVQYGERKNLGDLNEGNKKDSEILKKYKKNKEGKYEGEVLNLSDKKYSYNLNEFKKIISDKKYDFKPDWQTGKEEKKVDIQESLNEYHGSFMTRFFKGLSISEIISGGKMMIDGITESMKRGNDVHAANVALALGKILPEEVRADLQAKVDGAESEAMDKELKKLGDVETAVAVGRIEKWLLNKDTAEYKKEAGLLFMISKYGFLNTKGLAGYRGKWIWYEAFGGQVGDRLFLEKQAEAKKDGIPFTEEKLMLALLTDQCRDHNYSSITRRGRLYKDYDGKQGQGTTDELAKGHKEAEAMRSFDSRNGGALGEGKKGEFNNALGKYKSAIERGSSLVNMNEFPFVVAFSGAGYNLQEEQLNEFKAFIGTYGGLIFTKFVSDVHGMELFTDTIVELSRKFEEKDPDKFRGMYKKALLIKDNQKNGKIKERGKMEDALSFWKAYGKPITRAMHNLNNQDNEFQKTDKIIFLDEDNSVFTRYKKEVAGYVSEGSFKDSGIMDDQFSNQGITGLGNRVFSQIGGLSQEGKFNNGSAAKKAWREIVGEIKNINNKHYDGETIDSIENKKAQKKNLINVLRGVVSYIAERGSQGNLIKGFVAGKGDMGFYLKELGISKYINDENILKYSSDDLGSGKHDNFLGIIADDILSGAIISNNMNYDGMKDPFESVKNDTKGTTSDVIDNDNDYDYDMVA